MRALLLASLALALPAVQDPDPGGRYGEFLWTNLDLREPERAAWPDGGRVFVVEAGAGRVTIHEADGRIVRTLELGEHLRGGARTAGIAFVGDVLWISDARRHALLRIALEEPDAPVQHVGRFGAEPGQLAAPHGIDAGAAGLWVADSGNDRVQLLGPDGTPLLVVGSHGAAEGELREPTDVAALPDGGVLVADTGNHRIQRFDVEGDLVASFGARGPNPGLFSSPVAVDFAGDLDGGRVYVADQGNHRIQVFTLAGEVLYEWGIHALRPREGEGKLHYPSDVAVSPDGEHVIVCEAFSDRVQVFGRAEGPVERYMTDPATLSGGPARHYGMTLDAGADLLAIAEPETESVLLFAVPDTTPLMAARLGGFGTAADELARVTGIALAPSGRELVITDARTRRLSFFRLEREPGSAPRFDPTLGTFVRSVDLEALRRARFPELDGPIRPGAVARGEDGTLYVADPPNARVLVLSPELELLRQLGHRGRGWHASTDDLEAPTDVEVVRGDDGLDEVLVVDAAQKCVVVFGADGPARRELRGALVEPFGVAVAPDGRAFVTDAGAHEIAVFSPEGERVATIGEKGLGPVQFYKPRGIAVDPRGRLVVLDHGNHRGQLLTLDGELVEAFGSRLYARAANGPPRRASSEDE